MMAFMIQNKYVRNIGVGVIWFGIWMAAAAAVGQKLLLPSPIEVLQAFLAMAKEDLFWKGCILSVFRMVAGFAVGVVTGFLFAAFSYQSAWMHAFLKPFVATVNATPVVSFIMLAYVWIRSGGIPIFTSFLIVLPVSFSNMMAGLGAMDPLLLEMGRAFQMNRRNKAKALYWPMLKPCIYATVASGMGMAWKAGIAAEVIATPKDALGSSLYQMKVYLDTPGLFACTAVIIVFSVLLEKGALRLLKGKKV